MLQHAMTDLMFRILFCVTHFSKQTLKKEYEVNRPPFTSIYCVHFKHLHKSSQVTAGVQISGSEGKKVVSTCETTESAVKTPLG